MSVDSNRQIIVITRFAMLETCCHVKQLIINIIGINRGKIRQRSRLRLYLGATRMSGCWPCDGYEKAHNQQNQATNSEYLASHGKLLIYISIIKILAIVAGYTPGSISPHMLNIVCMLPC